MSKSKGASSGARTRARELMVQALYQKQLAGHSTAELVSQFHAQAAYERVDQSYFDEQFPKISDSQLALENKIDELIDRPLEQLDPVELAILLIGVYELESRLDIPYRVVINERP
jgi:N utilization substance protein B